MPVTYDEYVRIEAARNTLRSKAVSLGISTSTAKLDELAAAYNAIVNNGSVSAQIKEGETYTIARGWHDGGTVRGIAGGGNYALQSKGPIVPTKSQQTIYADDAYYGLLEVILGAIPSQYNDTSRVTAAADQVLSGEVIVGADGKPITGTMPNNGTVNAQIKEGESYTVERGYYDGGVIQGIAGGGNYALQAKGPIAPNEYEQTITPDSGYYGLSRVVIGAAASAPTYARAESTKF